MNSDHPLLTAATAGNQIYTEFKIAQVSSERQPWFYDHVMSRGKIISRPRRKRIVAASQTDILK